MAEKSLIVCVCVCVNACEGACMCVRAHLREYCMREKNVTQILNHRKKNFLIGFGLKIFFLPGFGLKKKLPTEITIAPPPPSQLPNGSPLILNWHGDIYYTTLPTSVNLSRLRDIFSRHHKLLSYKHNLYK